MGFDEVPTLVAILYCSHFKDHMLLRTAIMAVQLCICRRNRVDWMDAWTM